ncbi:MAG: tRNA lysidine(34) synthetase TilS, partial [Ignavibacteriae bacterium]|nr:tRNA lysidine(34) synthetase TilS [Ignavibacteriota bacterium]
SENIDFVEDSTNNDLSFRRNFIRKEILPKLLELNPSLNRVVLNTSEVFSNQKRVLDYFINELFEKIVSKKGKDFLIDLSELKKYPNEVLGEILKLTFEDLLKLDFNYNDFLQFQDLISKQVGTKLEFSQKFAAIKDRGQIRIVKNSKSLNNIISVSLNSNTQIDGKILEITELKEIPLKIVRNKNEEILCADKLEKKLKLRRWKNGDKIQLLGMKGTKKISDVLTDLKIPSSEKEHQMVLLNGNDIVYLVGLKISEKYKVTEETKSAVKICLK